MNCVVGDGLWKVKIKSPAIDTASAFRLASDFNWGFTDRRNPREAGWHRSRKPARRASHRSDQPYRSSYWCPETESNRHVLLRTRDFKSRASASFAIRAGREPLQRIYQLTVARLGSS